MAIITYGDIITGRTRILEHLARQRLLNPQFRVIDVGGVGGGGWSNGHVDLVVDINSDGQRHQQGGNEYDTLRMDICRYTDWDQLKARVARDGPFDYAICCHTLEDIYNPITALEELPKIARAGVITAPSLRTELSYAEHLDRKYLGYIHHRWILDTDPSDPNRLMLMPKMGFLESDFGNHYDYSEQVGEFRYEWEGTIDFGILMNNYFGPDASTVVNCFRDYAANRQQYINQYLTNIAGPAS